MGKMDVLEMLRIVEYVGERCEDEEVVEELRKLWAVLMRKVVV